MEYLHFTRVAVERKIWMINKIRLKSFQLRSLSASLSEAWGRSLVMSSCWRDRPGRARSIDQTSTPAAFSSVIGTLSKSRRRRHRGHGKIKDLIGRIAQHVRLKLCTFLSRPMQSNNLKSPQFASSANRNRDCKLFEFPFGTQRLYVMLKLRCGAVWDSKQMQPFLKF